MRRFAIGPPAKGRVAIGLLLVSLRKGGLLLVALRMRGFLLVSLRKGEFLLVALRQGGLLLAGPLLSEELLLAIKERLVSCPIYC